MNAYQVRTLWTWMIPTIAIAVALTSCSDESSTDPESPSTDITYPAAFVVNGGSSTISVIDLATNDVRRVLTLPGMAWPHHINLNANGSHFALGVPGMDMSGGHGMGMGMGMPGMLVVLDAVTGEVAEAIDLPGMNHNSAYSPDGSEIWTCQMDSLGTVLVCDATTLAILDTIAVGEVPAEITFSADGSMACVANGMSNTVTMVDVMTKGVMETVPVGMNPVGAWPGANNKMYVDNEDGQSITVIDVPTMAAEETVPLGFTPGYAAYHAGLNELWVTDSTSGGVVYFQRSGNQWTSAGSIPTGAGAHALAFTADGSRAYVTNQMAGTVSVIDTSMRMKIKDVTVGTKPNGIVLKQ
jgi:YVTN family beta-propeller protein